MAHHKKYNLYHNSTHIYIAETNVSQNVLFIISNIILSIFKYNKKNKIIPNQIIMTLKSEDKTKVISDKNYQFHLKHAINRTNNKERFQVFLFVCLFVFT